MSNLTETAIKAAFIKLLDEKPLSKITVKDIANECGINRNSFYYHFQDIPTLLRKITEEEAERVISEYPSVSSFDDCARIIVEYASQNRRLISHIFNSVNHSVLLDNLTKMCDGVVGKYMDVSIAEDALKKEDRPILAAFLRSLMLGMIIDWVSSGMRDDAKGLLHRMVELSKGVPELIAENSLKTDN